MAERTVNGYKRLFEVRILHHYWLDEGAILWDAITDVAKKDRRLLTYDMRSFLSIKPTVSTERTLKGLQCVFKETALGCVVAVPKEIVIPSNAIFEFVLTIQNADFFNYTAGTLRPQKIYELYHQPEDKIYRYKEGVPVLSNLTGVPRGTGLNKTLFLSKEFPALTSTDTVESLIQSGSALFQLTSDQPSPSTQQLGSQFNVMPVFVNQNDFPTITPPAGLVGAPAKGIELTPEILDDSFALVRITAVRPSDADFSTTSAGIAKTTPPVFQIRFKNRSTVWKYFNKNTGIATTTEANSLPLTFFGNAGSKQKPSAGFVKANFSGVKVTELFSEIFE